jgi:methylmalonyl-CoA mutase
VTAGGVIPPQDYDYLYKQGVSFIFGPGTVIPDAAKKIMERQRTLLLQMLFAFALLNKHC